ncbi:translational activator GCN1 [Rhizoctonia solani AG-3 Rhs1AP]|uniref:Translational activator GCN1 n=1 Tax=Rhizoctonia solani AG-3 Rhs1AP TaxID=1086054 RepID=X8J7I5_9AGAM|nr:translational activator GCN1 [Rhizoctonia solani AG-3 Rhs1AP]
MSKAEIHSWITTAQHDDGSDDGQDAVDVASTAINEEEDWAAFLVIAQRRLLGDGTRGRIEFLKEQLGIVANRGDISQEQSLEILRLLMLTAPRYSDSDSRHAVLDCLNSLLRRDVSPPTPPPTPSLISHTLIAWITKESSKPLAPSNYFVLLTWIATAFTAHAKSDAFSSGKTFKVVVNTMAVLVDAVAREGKSGAIRSAFVLVRRTLRNNHALIPTVIDALLEAAKSASTPLSSAVLIGIAVDVTLRLRPAKVGEESPGVAYMGLVKANVLAYYSTHVLLAKSAVPEYILKSFHDFVQNSLTEEDLTNTVVPAAEKAILRSPEVSLDVLAHLFTSLPSPLSPALFTRVITPALNATKSTNPAARSGSIRAIKSLLTPPSSKTPLPGALPDTKPPSNHKEIYALNIQAARDLILTPLQTAKTSSADHRATLIAISSALPESQGNTANVLNSVIPGVAKDGKEDGWAPVGALLKTALAHNEEVSKEVVAALTKEMSSSKVPVRRAVCAAVGNALWELEAQSESWTPAAASFLAALSPALEANLKTASATPLNLPAGPLEGYVAAAIGFAKGGKDGIASKNPVLTGIAGTAAKPSFLLWDKVWGKVNDPLEEIWLVRAAVATFEWFEEGNVKKAEGVKSALGSILTHCAVRSIHHNTRRLALEALSKLAQRFPKPVVSTIVEAVVAATETKPKAAPTSTASTSTSSPKPPAGAKPPAKPAATPAPKASTPAATKPAATVPDDGPQNTSRPNPETILQAKFSALLAAVTPNAEHVEEPLRGDLMVEMIGVAHRGDVSSSQRQLWVDLCLRAKLDPHVLVTRKVDRLLELVLLKQGEHSEQTMESAYRALSSIVFIAPGVVLPHVISEVRHSLAPAQVEALGAVDFAIWRTPKGTMFHDVLANKKGPVLNNKSKDADIEKWEAEIRKTLESKKAAGTKTLSKQEQAQVNAQLQKEDAIRSNVQRVKNDMLRGLSLIKSLVAAGIPELSVHVASIAKLLLDGALKKGSVLVGSEAFETYLDLANMCSDRLDIFKRWIGVATLRVFDVPDVPEELKMEPLAGLIVRVLYRLRSLSEQSPFDPSTYAYMSPFIDHVIRSGSIATTTPEEALEQVTLALDIIQFHCGEFSDPAYPRIEAARSLIYIIGNAPKAAKSAVSALVDLGQSISANVTEEETNVLLRSTLAQEAYVRNACLQTLQPFDLTELDWSPEIWIACHDEDEQNARLARHLWDDNGLDVSSGYISELLPFLDHENKYVRTAVGEAIAESAATLPDTLPQLMLTLEELYREKAKILAPEFDEYGMVIESSLDRADPWPARAAIANTFRHLAPYFTETEVVPFFEFLIKDEALGDRHATVRRNMLDAGNAVLDLHGDKKLQDLIEMFEKQMSSPSTGTDTSDNIREAVVVLFGRHAGHLEASDPRVPQVVDRLVEALKTPSEVVQIAVADCLPALVKLMKPRLPKLVDHLFDELINGAKYAQRRGAAYGLAGVLKGRGIMGFKEFDIVGRLRRAMDDKKRFEARQGVVFVFETLSSTLGRLFEPYIPLILPLLLGAFGDGTPDVRDATIDASKVIMANMSGYGVKLILPTLLETLEEKQWRTKKGSIELLGAMAYCAPKQLSVSLPTVIPQLTGVLTDSHAQVRTAANKSLKQFGEVISNPEIQSLVPTLLKAMVDPDKTSNALTNLLKTSFVHYIDSPSLALLVPIIVRGLKERSSDTKRKAVQIVGNLSSLTDSKDFIPYLSQLMPLVHVVLVDPVPEARATAAKALGTLIERLGEANFPDMVDNLLQTLKTDTSGVDRQGAAQGLSEVLSGLGMERMEALLPEVIASVSSPRPYVREGFMSLLVYLPATFGHRFTPHLARIIPPILNGLADSEESVRSASMKAGRMIVSNYSTKAIDLLLPELEKGMFDSGWRIRHSSITLVGELLFRVSGISGKAEIEEDEEAAVDTTAIESSRRALTEALGKERRDRVLAALYIIRQDAVAAVRLASIHIWKALVANTPRTVRDLLPTLIDQIVNLLASPDSDQRETAARTIAELCRKLGEKILGEIVPLLRSAATSPNPATREGVCLVLTEIMLNTTESQREGHEAEITAAVRVSLVDSEPAVRAAAAQAFDVLQEHLGAQAIDQTIPTLLEALRDSTDSSGTALQALKEVMMVRATTVFPVLIPSLITLPITISNARAMASLVTVAGNALSKRLTQILTALVKSLETEEDQETREAVKEATTALLGSISDAEGLNTLMMLLISWVKHDNPRRRITALELFGVFCQHTELDFEIYRIDWIRVLVPMLDDSDESVIQPAWNALDEFVKSLGKDDLESLSVPLRRALESTGGPGRYVPGLALHKGLSPLLPIIFAGLTTGNSEQREQSAYAIGDLVTRTEESALKPFTTQLTGPLIRVITQATTYPPAVKSAILSALTTLLAVVPTFVKPFFPQLQRTFVKAVQDPASLVVRTRAAEALGVLMKNHTRGDVLATELLKEIRATMFEDEPIAASLVLALAGVVKNSGANVGSASRQAIVELILDSAGKSESGQSHQDHYNTAVGQLFASLGDQPDVKPIIDAHILVNTPTSPLASQLLLAVAQDSPQTLVTFKCAPSAVKKVIQSIGTDQPSVARPAREARDVFKTSAAWKDDAGVQAAFG